jgi:AAA domain
MTNEFLTDLFGEQEGIVYSPIKGEKWEQHFFEWPKEQLELERHIENYDKRDVYLSPVLFNDRKITPETFKGTNYLWTEFDGTVPTDVIEPTMRVMSSQEGHEHWYWKLDQFVTDKVLLEDVTRRIAYHYGADLSVWDYQNVLRPVDTWNHKRNKPVVLIAKNELVYSLDKFFNIPIPPAGTKVDVKLGNLPTREVVLAKYKWKLDTLDLLFKTVATGGRSTALMRLAFDAIEVGCSNEEAYVLVEERDRAWGKYVGRSDREKQLYNTIAKARGKKLVQAELHQEPTTEIYRFHDFMKSTIKLKWAIEGLLPVAGSMLILGKPGIGKSTFSLRMAMSLALGDEFFLNWKIVNRQKVLFVSLEMQYAELKQFFEDMKIPEEVQNELQEWFHIWPIGFAYPFDVADQQPELLKFIDRHGIALVIIDSLGLSMYGSTKNDDDVKRLNSFLNEDVRSERKCGYVFIHHDRKLGIEDSQRVADLDDSFGSRYITANAQTVVLLGQKKGTPRLQVKLLKTRMAIGLKEFEIERTPDRGFKLVGAIQPALSIGGKAESDKKPDDKSLGKLFAI